MTRRRIAFSLGLVLPLATMGMLVLAHASAAPVLLKNVTSSMPLGLYRRVDGPIAVGSVVAVRQPAIARPYLRELGFPSDALLLKRVAALAPGHACAEGQRVWGDPGWTVGRMDRDRLGRRLPAWRGCGRLAPDSLMLLGEDPRSFDSRYFGPVVRSEVVGVYEPLQ